jgi:hypothetical protein
MSQTSYQGLKVEHANTPSRGWYSGNVFACEFP